MSVSKGNSGLISLLLSVYVCLCIFFLRSYRFAEDLDSILVFFSLNLLSILILEYTTLRVLTGLFGKRKSYLLYVATSFFLVPSLTTMLLFFLFSKNWDNWVIYLSSVLVSVFFPTLLAVLYFLFKQTKERILQLEPVSKHDNKNQKTDKMFQLINENGKILLDVPMDHIICYEANDNYVITHYLNKNNDLKKSMDRVSLKKIEDMIVDGGDDFVRVHKSYIINKIFLEEVKGRSQAYKLKLRHFDSLVPVSRSFDIELLGKS